MLFRCCSSSFVVVCCILHVKMSSWMLIKIFLLYLTFYLFMSYILCVCTMYNTLRDVVPTCKGCSCVTSLFYIIWCHPVGWLRLLILLLLLWYVNIIYVGNFFFVFSLLVFFVCLNEWTTRLMTKLSVFCVAYEEKVNGMVNEESVVCEDTI